MLEFLKNCEPIYAYIIIFLGSLIEGESIVLTVSAWSYLCAKISLTNLILLAFMGSMTADQILFFVGRRYGPRIIESRESWKEASKRVFYHLHRHSTLFIISFRFIYGVRTISPIVIGAAGIDIKRFAILNFIAAFFWALISCTAGYLIGYFVADSIEEFILNIEKYQKYIAGAIVLGVIFLVAYVYKKTHQGDDEKQQ